MIERHFLLSIEGEDRKFGEKTAGFLISAS